ncbi:MAG: FKBP-type peptidyl-prolyl cis-trans isomerase [Simkania sp.]|nr:FKBP-type peptidyl-prolyl cis-trans isomerase [Simkania sp.]
MNRNNLSSLLLSTLLMASIAAEEPSTSLLNQTQEAPMGEADLLDKEAEKIALISEAFGHVIAKHIDSLGVDFDLARLVKGLKDAEEGKVAPLSDVECIEAITQARQQAFDALATTNLEKASLFMKDNAEKTNVTTLEEGKLQIRIDHEGTGPAVQEGCMPIIRYVGKFIDGSTFGASQEDDVVVLDETIPGFGKGLMGMKEGEKRTLFIHPDLAYGTMGQLPPNSLLIFEIELVKATSEATAKEITPSNEPLVEETAMLDLPPPVEMQ